MAFKKINYKIFTAYLYIFISILFCSHINAETNIKNKEANLFGQIDCRDNLYLLPKSELPFNSFVVNSYTKDSKEKIKWDFSEQRITSDYGFYSHDPLAYYTKERRHIGLDISNVPEGSNQLALAPDISCVAGVYENHAELGNFVLLVVRVDNLEKQTNFKNIIEFDDENKEFGIKSEPENGHFIFLGYSHLNEVNVKPGQYVYGFTKDLNKPKININSFINLNSYLFQNIKQIYKKIYIKTLFELNELYTNKEVDVLSIDAHFLSQIVLEKSFQKILFNKNTKNLYFNPYAKVSTLNNINESYFARFGAELNKKVELNNLKKINNRSLGIYRILNSYDEVLENNYCLKETDFMKLEGFNENYVLTSENIQKIKLLPASIKCVVNYPKFLSHLVKRYTNYLSLNQMTLMSAENQIKLNQIGVLGRTGEATGIHLHLTTLELPHPFWDKSSFFYTEPNFNTINRQSRFDYKSHFQELLYKYFVYHSSSNRHLIYRDPKGLFIDGSFQFIKF